MTNKTSHSQVDYSFFFNIKKRKNTWWMNKMNKPILKLSRSSQHVSAFQDEIQRNLTVDQTTFNMKSIYSIIRISDHIKFQTYGHNLYYLSFNHRHEESTLLKNRLRWFTKTCLGCQFREN